MFPWIPDQPHNVLYVQVLGSIRRQQCGHGMGMNLQNPCIYTITHTYIYTVVKLLVTGPYYTIVEFLMSIRVIWQVDGFLNWGMVEDLIWCILVHHVRRHVMVCLGDCGWPVMVCRGAWCWKTCDGVSGWWWKTCDSVPGRCWTTCDGASGWLWMACEGVSRRWLRTIDGVTGW